MSERPVRSVGGVEANAANQFRIPGFDALDRRENYASVLEIHATITVKVVHSSIMIAVDVDVRRITKLVTTITSPAAFVAKRKIVLRSAETGENLDVTRRN